MLVKSKGLASNQHEYLVVLNEIILITSLLLNAVSLLTCVKLHHLWNRGAEAIMGTG